MLADKIRCFDYLVYRIITKNMSEVPNVQQIKETMQLKEFNKLKLLKLLFFVSTIRQDDGNDLLDIFGNFYAMPYGPVESDVYNDLSEMPHFVFEGNTLNIKDGVVDFNFDDIRRARRDKIDKAINTLYSKNSKIFSMPTFDLVELSHKALAWKTIFESALRSGCQSKKMPVELIKETTIFYN